jgi:hypothetical protein
MNPSLHFTLLFVSTSHFPSLHFYTSDEEVWLYYPRITQINGRCGEETTLPSVCLFHPQTRKVQKGIHCIPSLLADSLFSLYRTQSITLGEKDDKFSLFFNIERESFRPIQWYGGTIIAILANSPLFVKSVCVCKRNAWKIWSTVVFVCHSFTYSLPWGLSYLCHFTAYPPCLSTVFTLLPP